MIGVRRLLASLAVVLVALGAPSLGAAHLMPTSSVALKLGTASATANLELPLGRLAVALNRSLTTTSAAAGHAAIEAYIAKHLSAVGADGGHWAVSVGAGSVKTVRGSPYFVSQVTLTPPGGTMTKFTLHYGVIVDQLVTHRVIVTLAQGSSQRTLGVIDWTNGAVAVPITGVSAAAGVLPMIRLGFEHVSSGSDHLLFLLTLLLPAPLIARKRRWARGGANRRAAKRIFHVVTAFAVGHSLTLAAAAFGLVSVPARPVEFVIAFSIAVASIHALRPLVHGGEAKIAFSFGLVHGLAFAEVLKSLGLNGSDLVFSLLGFNLGIELTQLAIVALVMPSLCILARRRGYDAIRTLVGVLALIAAFTWMVERTGIAASSPIDTAVDFVLVSHAIVVIIGLAAVAFVSLLVERVAVARLTFRQQY